MDDNEIIQKILNRDRRALSVFYHTYTPKLRRYIRVRVNNDNDVEEILQDTLFAVLDAMRDFQGKAKLSTFLYSICQHKVVDFYRRRRIKQVVFSQVPQLEKLVSPLFTPEEVFDVNDLKSKITTVLGRLIPPYRQILVLKYFDDFSVGEIAQKLSISFKSAESKLFRARKAFVELFLSI